MTIKSSAKKKVLTERNKVGRRTIYDEAKHIQLIHDVFNNMEGVSAFCTESGIGKKTFYNWINTYPNFKEAYEEALCNGARKWERLPLDNLNVSHPYWMTIMKIRFGYFKPRINAKSNATPKEKIETIWNGLKEGELSTQEAAHLTSLVVVQSNIENNNVEDDNTIKAQTNEQLKDRLAIIDEMIKKSK